MPLTAKGQHLYIPLGGNGNIEVQQAEFQGDEGLGNDIEAQAKENEGQHL